MKKLGLMGVIASAMLLVSFGAMTLSAEDGMGKCGKSKEKMMDRKMMDEDKMNKGKCGTKKEKEMKRKKNMMDDDDHGMKKGMMDDDDRNMKKNMMGNEQGMNKSMKCGTGKCGS